MNVPTQGGGTEPWCCIDDFEALERHQPAILARIAALPHGGSLFLAHPFQLLEDVGVRLTENFKRRLVTEEPALGSLSLRPYAALRANPDVAQELRVELVGLFRREETP